MRTLGAQLCLSLGPTCKVVHESVCWADARWDTYPTRHVKQLWKIEQPSNVETSPRTLPSLFGNWDTRRYDFHFSPGQLQQPFRHIGRGSRMLYGSLGLDISGALMVASVGRLNLCELATLLERNEYPRLYLLSELVDLSHLCGWMQ